VVSTPICSSWSASGEGPAQQIGFARERRRAHAVGAETEPCSEPSKLGRMPNTPIEPVTVEGSA
jgi:hypothetical protein